jgi:apolipoprotein N-acyltransferase
VVFVSNESEPPAKTFGFAGLYPLLLQTTKKPLKNQKTKLAKPLCGCGHFLIFFAWFFIYLYFFGFLRVFLSFEGAKGNIVTIIVN